jgi:hypothetical protein
MLRGRRNLMHSEREAFLLTLDNWDWERGKSCDRIITPIFAFYTHTHSHSA